jgi:hypothetical protein
MVVRALSAALALNRMAFGAGYLAAPERTGRGWIGKAAGNDATKVFTRALGARDLALGAGALQALARGQNGPARLWMAGHLVADATDLAATLAARRSLPRQGFLFATAMAGASTAIALAGTAGLRGGRSG